MHVLEAETKRSRRTQRQFAILFLDVDGLKKINDRHGHLVGSQALRRVAEALRASSRVVDTAARFRGAGLTLIPPESGAAAARLVAGRRLSPPALVWGGGGWCPRVWGGR